MAAKQADKEYQHISDLENALGSIDVRFYTSGTVKRPLNLTWGKSKATFPMSLAGAVVQLHGKRQPGPLRQQQFTGDLIPSKSASFPLLLTGLLAASTQSAFGHNKKTVIDPSVRVAKELTASQISVDFDQQRLASCGRWAQLIYSRVSASNSCPALHAWQGRARTPSAAAAPETPPLPPPH